MGAMIKLEWQYMENVVDMNRCLWYYTYIWEFTKKRINEYEGDIE